MYIYVNICIYLMYVCKVLVCVCVLVYESVRAWLCVCAYVCSVCVRIYLYVHISARTARTHARESES